MNESDLNNAVEVFKILAQWKREADLQNKTKSDEVENDRCPADVLPPMKINQSRTKSN